MLRNTLQLGVPEGATPFGFGMTASLATAARASTSPAAATAMPKAISHPVRRAVASRWKKLRPRHRI